MAIDRSLDLITSQHKVQPKFMAWLSGTLQVLDDNMTMIESIIPSFEVDQAVGVQLDLIGTIVGRSRVLDFDPTDGSSPVLDDANYRLALKAKIAQNQWDGTLPQIMEMWKTIFPEVELIMIDNQDMTMSVLLVGNLNEIATELVVGGYIIPKPIGVKMDVIGLQTIDDPQYIGMVVTEMDFYTLTAT